MTDVNTVDVDLAAQGEVDGDKDDTNLLMWYIVAGVVLFALTISVFLYSRRFQKAKHHERELSLYAANFMSNYAYQSECPKPSFSTLTADLTFVKLKGIGRNPSARIKKTTPTAKSLWASSFSNPMSLEEGAYHGHDDDDADFNDIVNLLEQAADGNALSATSFHASSSTTALKDETLSKLSSRQKTPNQIGGNRASPGPSRALIQNAGLGQLRNISRLKTGIKSFDWPRSMSEGFPDTSVDFAEPDVQQSSSMFPGTTPEKNNQQLGASGTFGANAAAQALLDPKSDEARRRRVEEREARFQKKVLSRRDDDALVVQTKRMFTNE